MFFYTILFILLINGQQIELEGSQRYSTLEECSNAVVQIINNISLNPASTAVLQCEQKQEL